MTTNRHGLTNADVAHLNAGEPAVLLFVLDGRRQKVDADELHESRGDLFTPLNDTVRYEDGSPGFNLVEVVSPKPPEPVRPDGIYELTNPKKGTIRYIQSFQGKWGTQYGSRFVFTDTEFVGWTVGPRFVPEVQDRIS